VVDAAAMAAGSNAQRKGEAFYWHCMRTCLKVGVHAPVDRPEGVCQVQCQQHHVAHDEMEGSTVANLHQEVIAAFCLLAGGRNCSLPAPLFHLLAES
jgi:hypothetical protein